MATYVNATRHALVLGDGRVVGAAEAFEAEAEEAEAYIASGEVIEAKATTKKEAAK